MLVLSSTSLSEEEVLALQQRRRQRRRRPPEDDILSGGFRSSAKVYNGKVKTLAEWEYSEKVPSNNKWSLPHLERKRYELSIDGGPLDCHLNPTWRPPSVHSIRKTHSTLFSVVSLPLPSIDRIAAAASHKWLMPMKNNLNRRDRVAAAGSRGPRPMPMYGACGFATIRMGSPGTIRRGDLPESVSYGVSRRIPNQRVPPLASRRTVHPPYLDAPPFESLPPIEVPLPLALPAIRMSHVSCVL